jgi:mannose-1-phosphate guanylyltransferase/phosphomannomutase
MNRDLHRAARMIKRAMISGFPSAGVNVQDLDSVPLPVARYYTAVSGAAGGARTRASRHSISASWTFVCSTRTVST